MFLSILIPNYGFSELTVRCIESIKSQTINKDVEIIICDQSDDSDRNSLLKTVSNISNARVVTLDKPDVLSARKTLIQEAVGKYVFFVDSDDYIDQNYITQLIQVIKKLKYPDLIITSYYIDKKNSCIKNDDLSFINDTNFITYFYCSDLVNTLWRKIFRKSLFDLRESSNLRSTNGDDWIISLSIVKNAKTICFEPSLCGYHYCMNDSSLTHTMTLERFEKSFSLKDDFLLSLEEINYQLLFKSKMTKFLSFCIISYRENKNKNIIKSSFAFVRNNFFNVLKIPRNAAHGLKQKLLYFIIKHKLFFLFFDIIKKSAKKSSNQ